ncbi:type IV toxin-antitoxin system AbiEi family antitoxin [Nocardioides sp. AE5]|uniref:type IV toxin-antitoxin system AbiEi family antitoxin n=1 Tax=Nocardioides sp. AE5 TaxID=2962573 RepID=UPI002880F9E9|nr:type IV toxin-antitoxin system AbiEi family antitoxin [Nocardioides sp. AE5]MDT0203752.1 type IV toxin-antitoxin system AbiEi family antitoxin [Nocardioides sp. AE5]
MLMPPDEPFHWSQRHDLEISDFTVRRWLRDGRVRRVLTGVYCTTELPDSRHLRAQCAALVLGDGMVLCDRSAAWLWGVDVHAPDERFTITDLEVAVPPDQTPPRRAGVKGVRRALRPDEIVTLHGVRVTTPARTAIDLACRRGRWQALATLDGFCRECGLTAQEYVAQLGRHGGRRGVTQARELSTLATALAESAGESWLRAAIIEYGLPAPEPQVDVTVDGIHVRLDLGYRHLRIAIEYDGEEFHGDDRREYDEQRREWLRSLGWHVIVVRKHQLKGAARQAWLDELAEVHAAFRARQAALCAAPRGLGPRLNGPHHHINN